MPDMQTPGIDLKVERVRAKVGVLEMADRMGISRTTLYNIEQAADVKPARVKQYRQALLMSDDVTVEATA